MPKQVPVELAVRILKNARFAASHRMHIPYIPFPLDGRFDMVSFPSVRALGSGLVFDTTQLVLRS